MKHRNRARNKAGRNKRILARNIGKLKTFNTTHGTIILNPLKRSLLNKPYVCQEYQEIMNNEINQIMENVKASQNTEG